MKKDLIAAVVSFDLSGVIREISEITVVVSLNREHY